MLLFGECTKDSGNYMVSIDNREPTQHSAHCPNGNMRLVQIVGMDLDPGVTHTIEITPNLVPGEELRLNSICIASGSPIENQKT